MNKQQKSIGVYNENEKGFTLLEVVISLLLVSMLTAGIYETAFGGLKRAEKMRNQVMTTALAQSLMEEWLAKESLSPGIFEGSAKGLTWQVNVKTENLEIASDYNVDFFSLTVVAYGKDVSTALNSLIPAQNYE